MPGEEKGYIMTNYKVVWNGNAYVVVETESSRCKYLGVNHSEEAKSPNGMFANGRRNSKGGRKRQVLWCSAAH